MDNTPRPGSCGGSCVTIFQAGIFVPLVRFFRITLHLTSPSDLFSTAPKTLRFTDVHKHFQHDKDEIYKGEHHVYTEQIIHH